MVCVLALTMIATPTSLWADGAKTLPYSYGFENNDLAAEGWTLVDCVDYSIIGTVDPHSGSYVFGFFSQPDSPQYLISPEIDSGGEDYIVSLYYYYLYHDANSLQVGYSTTTSDLSAFAWEDVAPVSFEYALYKKDIPSNAKYVAIKAIVSSVGIFDDFLFAVSGCLPPENLTASDITDHTATLTWTAPSTTRTITGYAYQYKKVGESTWSAEVTTTAISTTISNLSANTSYDIRIKTLYGDNSSADYATITILTDCSGSVSLPFSEDFENGMGCWRVIDGDANTKIDAPYKQTNAFSF